MNIAITTPRPPNTNPGIVPPWLQNPPVIVLPVEPGDDDVTLPVLPTPPTMKGH